jgi:HEPN domain-containing protein
MPLDPARVADVRAWLGKASDDLRAAVHDLAAEPPLLGDAAFHAQQAVEKSLKALLAWHDRPFRKTHSIDELGQACLALDASLRELIDRAAPLTAYAWTFRYPGEAEGPTREEAEDAVAIGRAIMTAITARLPPEIRS